jgi:putative transposase
MTILKAHRIKLNPTSEQEQYFWRAAGTARFSFNWGLAEYNKRLDHNREVEKTNEGEKVKVSGRLLKKEFNQIKPEWVNEVTCWVYQGAFDDLQKAFSMFWDKRKNGTLLKSNKPRKDGRPNGWPRFKSRNRTTPAFYLANTALKFDNHFVRFDKARVGPVNMCEALRFEGKVMSGRVTYKGGHWWLSVQVETEHEPTAPKPGAVGVDLGIKYLAVTSDGVVYENPRALYRGAKRLRRLKRKLDRQRRANNKDNFNENGTVKRGVKLEWVTSGKQKRTERALARLEAHTANIRREVAHEMTTDIATTYGIIGLEDLNIKGMMQNGRLSKAVADSAMYEKRRQIEYKAAWNGGQSVLIGRWFPSSKRCSGCGEINAELTLSEREWTCTHCDQVNHRDGNAAVNIRDEALRLLSDNQQAVTVLPGSDVKSIGANL